MFTKQNMTVGAGSGWSNADKSAYNSRLTTLENAVYSRLNSLENKVISRLTNLENKVNTSLQNVGAGYTIQYKSDYYRSSGGTSDSKEMFSYFSNLVCPLGKRGNFYTIQCPNRTCKNSCDLKCKDCKAPANPPCI